MAFDPTSWFAGLTRAWKGGSLLLLALGTAALASAAILEIGASLDPIQFYGARQAHAGWLWVAAAVLLVLAGFKTYQEKRVRALRLVPLPDQSFAHVAIQGNGEVLTQVACRFDVFNLVDQTMMLSEIRLARPRRAGAIKNAQISVQQAGGKFFGQYPIEPKSNTRGSAHLMIVGDITAKIRRAGVVISVSDQFGHWHRLNMPKLRIN